MALHRVFVYGTLKEGFRNFHVNRGTRVHGEFVTVEAFPLYVIGEFGLPWMVHEPGRGQPVQGQVFEIDDAGLAALDALERIHEPGWYTPRELRVQLIGGGAPIDALAYFGDAAAPSTQTRHLGPLTAYEPAHQALYRKHV